MCKSPNLQTLLKAADPAIRQHVAELKTENLKLQKQIAKFQVKEISSKNRITALEMEIKKQDSRAIAKLLKDVGERGTPLPIKS